MLIVGLTGGIGSGKSTVAAEFEKKGVPVLDADRIGKELVQPGCTALDEIRATFGEQMIDRAGQLDRKRLGGRVFSDPEARERLESILHPRIRHVMLERLAALEAEAPYAILVIPLLFETGQTDLVDRVLVVDIPESIQLARVQQRDGGGGDRVREVFAAQAGRGQRLAGAQDLIDNSGDLEHLHRQIDRLHARYLELA